MNGLDPGAWPQVAEKLGLGGALALMTGIGLSIGLATRGPEWIREFKNCLEVILTYFNERKRINYIIEENKRIINRQIDNLPQIGSGDIQ
jgi:hypothetical protein